MTIKVYTDASYYWQRDIAACGYVILSGDEMLKHEVIIVEKIRGIHHAEFFSIYNSLQHAFLVKDVSEVHLYSDNQISLNVCIGMSDFRQKGYGGLKNNFAELMDIFKEHEILVHFHKVKAHSKDYFNSMVDNSSRKHLRKFLKEQI